MVANKTKTILLVEDQAIIAASNSIMIQSFGYNVIIAYNGQSAIKEVESNPSINLVLMDIDLGPGMDGTEAAREILKERTLPIAFFTNHSEKEYIEKVKEITRYGYILKDTNRLMLQESIEMALNLFNAHQKSEKNELLLKKTGQTANVGGWEIDLSDMSLEWTDQVFIIHEEDSSTIPTVEKAINYYHEDSKKIISDAVAKAIETGEAFDLILKIVTAKNNIKWVHALGKGEKDGDKIVKVSGTFQDITENKEAQNKLDEQRKFIETIVNLSPNGLYTYDIVNKKNIYSNLGIKKILGYTVDEIQSMGSDLIPQLMHPDDLVYYAESIIPQYSTASDEDIIKNQFRMKHKSGHWCWLDCKEVIYKRLEDGSPQQILGVLHDISETKEYEDKIKKLLKDKDILLKEVHHRMKNNMHVLKSLFSLQDSIVDLPEIHAIYQDAMGRIEAMQVMYDTLYRSETYENVSIKEYICQLVDDIYKIFPKNPKIEVIKDIDDFKVKTDVIFNMGIIINELFTNSMKHAFIDRQNGTIKINLNNKENLIQLCYEDDGVGLPLENNLHRQKGFGLTLLDLLSQQLDAELSHTNKNGTQYVLEFKQEASLIKT